MMTQPKDLMTRLKEQTTILLDMAKRGECESFNGNLMREAIGEIEHLEAECFTLAAGTCSYRGGDEYGNPLCLKTNEPI